MRRFVACFFATALMLSISSAGWAEQQPSKADEVQAEAMFKEAAKEFVYGPATVKLGNQASLAIAKGQVFLPPSSINSLTAFFKKAKVPDTFYGAIAFGAPGNDFNWITSGSIGLNFVPSGFIKDDDAKNWDYGRLWQALKKQNEASNENALKEGKPEQELVNWLQTPSYSPTRHMLIWATLTHEKGKPQNARADYQGAVLGREGVFIFDYALPASAQPTQQNAFLDTLSATHFNEGKRYEDYIKGTDPVAKVGLNVLVGGASMRKDTFWKWVPLLGTVAAMIVALRNIRRKSLDKVVIEKSELPETMHFFYSKSAVATSLTLNIVTGLIVIAYGVFKSIDSLKHMVVPGRLILFFGLMLIPAAIYIYFIAKKAFMIINIKTPMLTLDADGFRYLDQSIPTPWAAIESIKASRNRRSRRAFVHIQLKKSMRKSGAKIVIPLSMLADKSIPEYLQRYWSAYTGPLSEAK